MNLKNKLKNKLNRDVTNTATNIINHTQIKNIQNDLT